MGSRLFFLGLAGGSLLLLGVGRPLDPAPPVVGRALIRASIEQFIDIPKLKEIHFGFDSSRIGPGELPAIEANVEQLKRLAPARILVEGHTDQWGSEEYNLRLGERRAREARDALIRRGLDRSAIITVSYGKVRPRCLEHHRVCWAENRRVHLRISVARPGFTEQVATAR